MRWTEERTAEGRTLLRQPQPYFGALYSELRGALASVLPPDSVHYGLQATSVTHAPDGGMVVHFDDGAPPIECDVLIAADGPRSRLREALGLGPQPLRFAGYAAWRGTVAMKDISAPMRANFLAAFPHYGNCLYFVHCTAPRQHAVIYDIGGGYLNWLIYQNCVSPVAEPGRTTSAATAADVEQLRGDATTHWGEAFGAIISATPEPFLTDVYDIERPLQSFASGAAALLGDAAHAITPHLAKGSNLAVHDAFTLACCAQHAATVPELLQDYSRTRAKECARMVLFSRHLGRVRNGLHPKAAVIPANGQTLEALMCSGPGVSSTATLPSHAPFGPLWKFADGQLQLPHQQRGLFLQPPSLVISDMNHVSRETTDVPALVRFYGGVLGLSQIARPDFGFPGAWFQLPGGAQLHLIQKDPALPSDLPEVARVVSSTPPPNRFIRRGHHLALTVTDITATKEALEAWGLAFATNRVPGTPIEQLFMYDPDGNGVEIANFGAKL